MLAFPATLRQRVAILLGCVLLAGCTRIQAVERFSIEGYWQTEGYVCQGESFRLLVRLEHDGVALKAYRQRDDACGSLGEVSWLGDFPSGEVRKSALPISFNVRVNVQSANEGVRAVPGAAKLVTTDELIIRTSDGTRFTLVRDFERVRWDDLPMDPVRPDTSNERAQRTAVETHEGAGNEAGTSGTMANVAGRSAANKVVAGSSANIGDSGVQLTAAGMGGSGGVTGAADRGAAGMTPSKMPEAGAVAPQQPDAGASEDPMEPAAGASAPTTTESRPTDRWLCIDSNDRQGLPYCNCTVDGSRHTDTCTLPKPTCCFMFNDILEQCLCYQQDSDACENFSGTTGVLGGTPVPTCPP